MRNGVVLVCRRFGPRAAGITVVAWLLGAAGAAVAQGVDCDRLYAAIQAADGASGSTRWDRAIQQQEQELDRARRYADQLRCGLTLFGDPSAQCSAIQDRIQRMEDNLATMQARSEQAVPEDGARRASLVARYNAQCVGANPADMTQRGGRGDAGSLSKLDDLSAVPLNGDIMDGSGEPQHGLGQAICVRTCDGGYFPLSPRATQDQLDGLQQLCQALCPATEAKLYTMGHDGDLTNATAADGTSYTALPAAFKFEKTFNAACTCKPAGKSWVDALQEAESLLGNTDRHDITVTASLSDQMAKPTASPPGKAGKTPRLPAAAKPLPDLSAAQEAQKAAQAPTASNDTSNIGGPVQFRRTLREGDGPTIGVAGPDGVKRTIRLIVP